MNRLFQTLKSGFPPFIAVKGGSLQNSLFKPEVRPLITATVLSSFKSVVAFPSAAYNGDRDIDELKNTIVARCLTYGLVW